jgi:hypothetical protein
MKAIGPTTSEKLHSQSVAGGMNERMKQQKNYIPPYYCIALYTVNQEIMVMVLFWPLNTKCQN